MVETIGRSVIQAREILETITKELEKGNETLGKIEFIPIPGESEILFRCRSRLITYRGITDAAGMQVIKNMIDAGYTDLANQKGSPNLTAYDKNRAYRNIRSEIAVDTMGVPESSIKSVVPKSGNAWDLCPDNICFRTKKKRAKRRAKTTV